MMRAAGGRAGGRVAQRAIDPALVESQKELLGIPAETQARVLEIPKGVKLPVMVGDLDAKYKLNVDDLNGLCLGEVMFPGKYDEYKTDADWLAEPAQMHMSLFGGAAYNDEFHLVIMSEGKGPRDLLHELGHFKQDLGGFTSKNANVTILEFHNVLLHENLFDNENLRLKYTMDALPGFGKTWEDLNADVQASERDQQLLHEIEAVLETEKYAPHAETIKKNLVFEYFKRKK